MTQTADLDGLIVAWLRDGEAVAPSRLATEIHLAISTVPARRGGLLRLPWTIARRPTARPLILVAAAVALAVALLGLLWASGSAPRPIPTATPGPSQGEATSSESPVPPAPSIAVVEPTEPPAPTYPPAATMSLQGILLDLPAGWYSLSGQEALGIIGALDEIGDPYAGVFNMILRPLSLDAGPFRYHSSGVEPQADAGMRFMTSGIQESTAPLEADRVRAVLEGAGYVVARSSVKLATGRAIVLEWDVAYNGPDLHYRAYFLKVGGAVRRIDIATPWPPSQALARQFLDIVRSVRPG